MSQAATVVLSASLGCRLGWGQCKALVEFHERTLFE